MVSQCLQHLHNGRGAVHILVGLKNDKLAVRSHVCARSVRFILHGATSSSINTEHMQCLPLPPLPSNPYCETILPRNQRFFSCTYSNFEKAPGDSSRRLHQNDGFLSVSRKWALLNEMTCEKVNDRRPTLSLSNQCVLYRCELFRNNLL